MKCRPGLFFLVAVGAFAQLKVSVDLVQIDAVVTDSHGNVMRDLKPEDFEVSVDRKPVAISNLSFVDLSMRVPEMRGQVAPVAVNSAISNRELAPEQVRRTMVFFIDDLSLSMASIVSVRQTLKRAIEQYVQPGDLAAVVPAHAGLGALQLLSTDKQYLVAAADRIQWSPAGRANVHPYRHNEDDLQGESAALATVDCLRRVIDSLAELPGRKMLFFISDGLPLHPPTDGKSVSKDLTNAVAAERGQVAVFTGKDPAVGGQTDSELYSGSDPLLGDLGSRIAAGRLEAPVLHAIDDANRAGVAIHAIDVRGLVSLHTDASEHVQDELARVKLDRARKVDYYDEQAGLQMLADGTGGRMVTDTNDAGASVGNILEAERGYYLLAFTPPEEAFKSASNGKPIFHGVSLRVKRPGAHVRYRRGFFGVSGPAPNLNWSGDSTLADALFSPFHRQGVRMKLTTGFLGGRENSWFIRTALVLDAHDLNLQGPETNRSTVIRFVVRAYNVAGEQTIGGVDQELRVSLDRDGYERAMKWGLVYQTMIPVDKDGPYQVRALCRDEGSGALGTAGEFLVIPSTAKKQFAMSSLLFASEGRDKDIVPAPRPPGFKAGQSAPFAFQLFNGEATTVDLRLFRDGQLILENPNVPLQTTKTSATGHALERAELKIPANATPGEYDLQVIANGAARWSRIEVVQ